MQIANYQPFALFFALMFFLQKCRKKSSCPQIVPKKNASTGDTRSLKTIIGKYLRTFLLPPSSGAEPLYISKVFIDFEITYYFCQKWLESISIKPILCDIFMTPRMKRQLNIPSMPSLPFVENYCFSINSTSIILKLPFASLRAMPSSSFFPPISTPICVSSLAAPSFMS